MIPYGRQDIRQEDIDAVVDVLRSDFLTQGPMIPKFERCVAEHCAANYGIATTSATAALHVALLSLGVGKGDIVWTSPITFVASANTALYCGASVDFVDIDQHTNNLSVSYLAEKLKVAEKQGCLPKVVIPVHFTGQSCDMKAIHELSRKYGFKIIEDASHALGGRYEGKPVGSCEYSDISVFSFHPVKIITSGEGGMAVTNDATIAHEMSLYRSHGITKDVQLMENNAEGPWYYEQIKLGYNYRMTDIQAALGISQMSRLDEYIELRQKIAKVYDENLKDLPLTLPFQETFAYSSFHLYVIRTQDQHINSSIHKELFSYLRNRNIMVNIHYIPVHTQPFYKMMGFEWGEFPNSEDYYRNAISLPIFPNLCVSDQLKVISALHEFFR